MGASRTPWQTACALHAALCAGEPFPSVQVPPAATHLARECDEYAIGVFGPAAGLDLNYARFVGESVVVGSHGPAIVVGNANFLTGYALGSMASRMVARRRAQRMAEPQWRLRPMAHAVVTTHRVWCEIPGDKWAHFSYDAATALRLTDDNALVMYYPDPIPPVRLGGSWAPWIAVAVAHLKFGPTADIHLPWLNKFRISTVMSL
jgi:hypothetical protein